MTRHYLRLEIPVRFKRDRRARSVLAPDETDSDAEPVPRLARLLALAHKWEGMVRRAEVRNYAEIAKVTGLTKGRVAQISSLALLAPVIQEEILTPPLKLNRCPARVLRHVAAHLLWDDQRNGMPRRADSAIL